MSLGLIDLPWWGYVLVTLGLTHVTIVSVTLYLHRAQAHRALELHPLVSHFFRLWLWMSTGMVTKQWVAIHRKHHAKVETPEDPHSPHVEGIKKVLFDGAALYTQSAKDAEILEKYGHGTPDDWLERHVYSKHDRLGVTAMALINLALFGPIGLSIWAVQMIWIPFWAAGVINGLGHYWGYRNFEPRDGSTNLSNIGILIGGEEMHNNHHAFPSSAKFSVKWWEFDIGWFYINLLRVVGMARVKKLAPRPVFVKGKDSIDLDTVRAVVIGRMHLLSQYAQRVIHPVMRDELAKADLPHKRLLKQIRSALIKDESRVDATLKGRIASALSRNQSLDIVYQYREKLQEVWSKTYASQEKLLQALQEWCAQAEATGVRALQDFARSIRGYALVGAPA